jgi:hypothetical protein
MDGRLDCLDIASVPFNIDDREEAGLSQNRPVRNRREFTVAFGYFALMYVKKKKSHAKPRRREGLEEKSFFELWK